MSESKLFKAILIVSAFCFASCEREAFLLDDGFIAQDGRELTFTASMDKGPLTRTQKADGSDDVLWSSYESINVFYGNSGSCFESDNSEPAMTVSFRGTLSSFTGTTATGEPLQFWSVYPYHRDNAYSNSSVSAVLPSTQTCPVNNFPNKTRLMVAKSSGLVLSFRQVCSMLRVNIPAGIDDITRITLQGNNEEILAGRVSVSFDSNDNPEWTAIEGEGDKIITILPSGSATFASGNYYIPLLPQTLENGYTITYYRTGTYGSRSTPSAALFERNKVDRATSASQITTWTPLEHPSNEIWYTSFDGREITYDTSFGNDAHIVNEVTETIAPSDNDGVGIIRFASALTVIDKLAFDGAHYLTSIVFPETVTTISAFAFNDCTSLASVEMGDNVKYIERNAFAGCSFENIHLSESLLGIGYGAFSWNSELSSITIPESVVTLGYPYYYYENPFAGCTALESFSGKFATDDGHALLYGNSLSAKDVLVSFAAGALVGGTYDVPDGVDAIAPYAFAGARISGVNLNAVSNIMQYAFNDTALKSVHLTTNVGFINHHAFDGSNQLEYIRIDVTTSLPSVGPEVFDGSTCPIYVPAAWLEVFKTADRWSSYADRYQALPTKNQIVYLADSEISVDESWALSSHTFSNGCGVLTFDDPVTKIPAEAFSRTGVKDVFLPEGLTAIGEAAFSDCILLKSITLPSSLQYLGAAAFDNTGLTSVTIPESVQYIGCTWDESSGEVTNHFANPFLGCDYLASFSGKYATSDGLFLVDNGYLVSGAIGAPALGEEQNCVIPSEVTTVGKYALAYGQFTYLSCMSAQVLDDYCFYGCSNLSFFEMGYNVREIRSEAFAIPNGITGTLGLVNFMLMNDLPEIATDAFTNQNYVELWISGWQAVNSAASMSETWGTSPIKDHVRVHQHWNEIWLHINGTEASIDEIRVAIENKFLREDGSVIGLNGYGGFGPHARYTVVPKSVFPEGFDGSGVYVLKYNDAIKQLADNAFSATGNALDYISLPNEVTTIGAGAFQGLALLKKFPGADNESFNPVNYLTSIGANAFNSCVSMAGSVPIPSVTSIGTKAFQSCMELSEVTLGAVTSIPNYAFFGCTALEKVLINDGNNGTSVTSVGVQAFAGCNALTTVTGAESTDTGVRLNGVTALGVGAFMECSSIRFVKIASASRIETDTFRDCVALASVVLGTSGLTFIGERAFYNCQILQAVSNTVGFTQVALPFVEWVGTSAFAHTRVRSVTIGSNVSGTVDVTIEASAFADCQYLTQINLRNTSALPNSCFRGCIRLTDVTVPKVELVSNEAFYNCNALQSLSLPAVTYIGDRAFAYTRGLTTLKLGANLTTLGKMIFYDDDASARNWGKLNLYFAGPYPTSLYSANDGATPTFGYTDNAQNLFWPNCVYVKSEYMSSYNLGFADDWDQSVSNLLMVYTD